MCSGIKKVVEAVIRAIKKVWDVVRKYIAYIAFFIVVFYPFLLPYVTAYLPATLVTALSGTFLAATTLQALVWRAVTGLAIAFLFSAEGARELVDKVKDVVSDTVQGVVEVGGAVVEGGVSGILSSPFALVAGAVILFILLKRDDDEGYALT